MSLLVTLPVLIPLSAFAISLLMWRRPVVQRFVSLASAVLGLASAVSLLVHVESDGIQSVNVGGWPAPYGIALVSDLLSATMLILAAAVFLAGVVYSTATIDSSREAKGYYVLLNSLMLGVNGAFLAGDMFNLFVWFELMLISSFVLMAIGAERQQLEGAIKYVALNLVASALFLTSVGLLYGLAGTLNMADLSVKLSDSGYGGEQTVVAMLLMISFGVKAGAFPLFFWLPASYHTPPVVLTAIFSGLLTKVGVYALIRVFTLVFVNDAGFLRDVILAVAALTMVTGVLGALAQTEMRRLLSFHIISQIGYLLMGLGLFTVTSLAGAIFFMVHVVFAKASLFLVAGVVQRLRGTYDLPRLGGLYRSHPALSVVFLVPALSLAGLPPFSGFFAKVALVKAGLEIDSYAVVAVALVVSVLTLMSMTKIWTEAFWKTGPGEAKPDADFGGSELLLLGLPVIALAAMSVLAGIAAEPVFTLANDAAEQLLNREEYITAVLGEDR